MLPKYHSLTLECNSGSICCFSPTTVVSVNPSKKCLWWPTKMGSFLQYLSASWIQGKWLPSPPPKQTTRFLYDIICVLCFSKSRTWFVLFLSVKTRPENELSSILHMDRAKKGFERRKISIQLIVFSFHFCDMFLVSWCNLFFTLLTLIMKIPIHTNSSELTLGYRSHPLRDVVCHER